MCWKCARARVGGSSRYAWRTQRSRRGRRRWSRACTHENQGYSIRCGTNAEYTQWTDAIKQIVAPPLSRGHAEEAVDGEVPGKKKSIFSRATSLGQGGKKKSVTE